MLANFIVKELEQIDFEILEQFLYAAIFQPDPENLIPFSAIKGPDLSKYIEHFGQKPGDFAIGALAGEEVVALVWVRLVKGYGHVDLSTPELNISVLEDYRGQGLGHILMEKMLDKLAVEGFKKVSLSVQKANRALKLYQALGFGVHAEDEETYTMVYVF